MSSGSGDLGVLRWVIDADDSALDRKLDRAEAKVRAWGQRIERIVPALGGPSGSPLALPAPTSTFGGLLGGPNAGFALTTQGAPWGGAAIAANAFASSGYSVNRIYPLALPAPGGGGGGPIGPGAVAAAAAGDPGGGGPLAVQVWRAGPLAAQYGPPGGAGGGGVGGGAATGGARSGLAFGLFRPLAAGYFALRGIHASLREYDRNREMDRALASGDIDDALSVGLSQARQNNQGFMAFARNHPRTTFAIAPGFGNVVSFINRQAGGSPDEIQDTIETAVLSRRGQLSLDAQRRQNAATGRAVGRVGLTGVDAELSRANEDLLQATQHAVDLRREANKLTGRDNATATALVAEANRGEALAGNLYRAQLGDATNRQAVTAGGLLLDTAASRFEAAGNAYAGQRLRAGAAFAGQEAGISNPIMRALAHMANQAQLGAMDAIHQRELTQGAEDLEVTTEELGARNPFLSSTATFAIRRRAIQNRKSLAVARFRAANPADARGAAALAGQYDAETDILDAQAAFQAQHEDIATQGELTVGALTLARQPRAAAIEAIRTRTRQNVIGAGVEANGLPSYQAMLELAKGGQQEQIENQREDDRDRLLNMRLGGESEVLAAQLGRTPETAGMSPTGRNIIGGFIAQRVQGQLAAQQLAQSGNPFAAASSLGNSIAQLDVMRQNLFQNVEARGVNLNLTDVQHPETSTENISKAIEQQRQALVQDLQNILPSILQNLLS
jgi:hypothetical protein